MPSKGYRRAHELGLQYATGSFVAGNLGFRLLETGRWGECEQLTREALASDTWGAFNLRVVRGVLLARQGNFTAAREELDLALRLGPPYLRDSAWLDRPSSRCGPAARTRRHRGRRGCAAGPSATCQHPTHPDDSLWYPLALRLEADRAEQAAARRAAEELAQAQRQAAPLVAELDSTAARRAAARPATRTSSAALLLARAEQSRLEELLRPPAVARGGPRVGADAASLRGRLRPLPGGRGAAGPGLLPPQAEQTLRSAHQTAVGSARHRCGAKSSRWPSAASLRLDDHLDTATISKAPSPAASSA